MMMLMMETMRIHKTLSLLLMVAVVMALVLVQPTTGNKHKAKAPRIHRGKSKIIVSGGGTGVISCRSSGRPKPEREWLRDGMPLNKTHARFSVNKKSRALRVFEAKVEDTGNYTCVARNKHGEDSISVEMVVVERPTANVTVSPHFVMEGMTAEITCTSHAVPTVDIDWYTNTNERLRYSPQDNEVGSAEDPVHSMTVTQTRPDSQHVVKSTLRIEEVSHVHQGLFVCQASNLAGSIKAEIDLNVYFAPKPLLEHAGERERTFEYHISQFSPPEVPSCAATGNELPAMEWFHNGQLINTSHCERLEIPPLVQSFLCTITEQTLGKYSCYAENAFGRVLIQEIDVKPLYPPRAVTVEIHPDHPNLIKVSVPVGVPNVPDSDYVIVTYAKLETESAEEEKQILYETTIDFDNSGEVTVLLPALKEKTSYLVSAAAKNKVGLSPVVTVTVTTGPAVTPYEELIEIEFPNEATKTSNRATQTDTDTTEDQILIIKEEHGIVGSEKGEHGLVGSGNETNEDDFMEAGVAYSIADRSRSSSDIYGSRLGRALLLLASAVVSLRWVCLVHDLFT